MSGTANKILLGLFLLHYLQRTLVYPFLIRGGKPTPAFLVFLAFTFCMYNGFLQVQCSAAVNHHLNGWFNFLFLWLISKGRYLTRHAVYSDDWLYDPRFIAGVIIFLIGMYINIKSDSTLRNLRKPGTLVDFTAKYESLTLCCVHGPGETGYKVPKGGMFEYVSGANFFGEILEWCGYALAAWSIIPFAFAFFTFSNTGPRGKQHHEWYLKKFNGYPKNRKAVIPFIW